jgi:hypothetical protein
MFFMTSHIIGNSISGAILGDQTATPPHDRVVRLFVVYASLGLSGCTLIVLFLRQHSLVSDLPAVAARASDSGKKQLVVN